MIRHFSFSTPWITRFSNVSLMIAVTVGPVYGQSTSEKRLEELRDQIAMEEAALADTEREEQSSLRTLTTINRQIGMREELVGTYRDHLVEMSAEREQLVHTITVLEDNLDDLKTEYRARATHAYKYGRLHDVALIMSAASINQMLIRIRYLHGFSEQRRVQLAEIKSSTNALKTRRNRLQRTLFLNEIMLNDVSKEQKRLGQLKQNRQKEITLLRNQKAGHQKTIDEKRSEAGELEFRIREALAAAGRGRSGNAFDAAAFAALSSSFKQNRGDLPWPSRGSVKEPFGELVNPEYGTKTPNLGVLIETEASAEVRSIFDGRVAVVDVMPEIGRYVIIEHGEFHSVYGNFSLLYIAEGETVKTGQLIGRSGTDAEPSGLAVFFGLFEDGNPVDPTSWLRK